MVWMNRNLFPGQDCYIVIFHYGKSSHMIWIVSSWGLLFLAWQWEIVHRSLRSKRLWRSFYVIFREPYAFYFFTLSFMCTSCLHILLCSPYTFWEQNPTSLNAFNFQQDLCISLVYYVQSETGQLPFYNLFPSVFLLIFEKHSTSVVLWGGLRDL